MKIGIMSDIHSNLEAMECVYDDIKECDKIICLGDIVGYGPDPEKCIEIVREISDVVIAGNHDYGVVGRTKIENFNRFAREAILWTREKLRDSSKNYLSSLSLIHKENNFIFSHSGFRYPDEWDYIIEIEDAIRAFHFFEEDIGFTGHSHIPKIFLKSEGVIYEIRSNYVEFEDNKRYIINPGSVGQPRDGKREASYLLLDTEKKSATIKRMMYDVEKTYEKILKEGLPEALGSRLFLGK